jgi:LysM repeat protein
MSPDKKTSKTNLCPVCGTKVSDSTTKCLVCGTALDKFGSKKKPEEIRAKRLPEITLSLPAALGLLALVITLGAVVIFLVINANSLDAQAGEVLNLGTPTATPTETVTPTITFTPTTEPTWTPLPPIEYTVKPGDLCSGIAATFGVSVQSIILENNLSADCNLFEGQELLLPQPTPTASPQPSPTLSESEKTEAACETLNYTVQANDTLSSIANTYNISIAVIREYNGLFSDTVFEGQILRVPLCERLPTPGPTPTPTPLPPYPGPNLLLPADGASFVSRTDTITLQWAAVGEMEANEAYAVTITDLTSDNKEAITQYVRETSLIVPSSFVPETGRPHIFRWSVQIVRQIGGGNNGEENWEIAGDKSDQRVFGWFSGSQTTTQ